MDAEIARQEAILEGGGEVEQETLHFDPQSGSLTSLRSKEEAHDYRYFPEPDLVPLAPTEEMLERARKALPELPAARAERFEQRARPAGRDRAAARLRVGARATSSSGRSRPTPATRAALANWVTNELAARLGDARPGRLEARARRTRAARGAWSATRRCRQSAAKEVLDTLVEEGGDPARSSRHRASAARERTSSCAIVEQAMADHADAVEKIRAGNDKAIGAIVGAVMRETKGRADGGEVQRLIRERIGEAE